MTFTDLSLQATYDSDEDNILDDFYIPVLSHAVRYERLAGYFSSASLAASAKGMAQFLHNGGKMKLVTSVHISKEDHRAILDGLERPDEVISRTMKKNIDGADQLQKDHISALAWMVAEKRLAIKIAIPLAHDGGFYTGELDTNSIYHQKIGILYDADGNVVSFSGSVNETAKAWNDNIEEFKVFCSWKPGQDVYGSKDAKKFEKFWHGNSGGTRVMDLPEAVREHLIKNAPETEADAISRISGTSAPVRLRDYQQEAVKRWLDNDRRGILAMATGTGKTWAAISCIKHVCSEDRTLVVITCPYVHLVDQWTRELKTWGFDAREAYGSSSKWRKDMGTDMEYLNSGIINELIIVTTHATFAGKALQGVIKSSKTRALLVADEVHKLGARKNSGGLSDTYGMRLGLSATPQRYFDDAGTRTILDYFGGVVFEFGLGEAIRGGYLTHYLLFPHVVYMTNDESLEYHKYSRQIAIEESQKKPDYDKILRLTIKRSNILKTARNKMDKFREVLQGILQDDKLDHCLVYCSHEEQLDEAASVLRSNSIMYHRFTSLEEPEDRKKLLAEFAGGDQRVLLAIKCLDEGVDVPSTRTAIILASSRNPIEFIQRRGRILRKYDGKDHAIIHDLIVMPKHPSGGGIHTESERTIILKELERLKEFAGPSDNPEYSEDLIQTLMNKYNLA